MNDNMNIPEKAIGYIRVSTDKQDFERQRQEIQDYAKRSNFLVVKFFEDKQSGSDYEDRAGFQDLLLFLEETPEVKIVIFDEVSRMGRDTANQVTTYKLLTKKGVRIFTRGKGEFGANKEDSLLFTVLSAIADYEKQTIVDRTSSGRRKVVKDGFTQISQKPYGYDLILTKKKDREVLERQFIKVNDEESKVVKEMFGMVANGSSVYDVLGWLAQEKIPSPKGKKRWGKSSVLRILHNTTYFGEWRFGKYVKNGKTKTSMSKRAEEDHIIVKVPHIIKKKLFDRVQKELRDNQIKFNPKNQKHSYILKGLTKCACGYAVQVSFDKKTGTRAYRCPERNIKGVHVNACPIRTLKADFIEKVLIRELKEKIEDKDFFKGIKLAKLEAYKAPTKKLEKEIESLEREILEKEKLTKQYYERSTAHYGKNPEKAKYFEELADEALKENRARKENLLTLKKDLENQVEKVVDIDMLKDLQKALAFITKKEVESFNTADQHKKQQFVRTYIKNIQLEMLKKETNSLLARIEQLKELGLWKKEHKPFAKLYFSVFDRNHKLKLKHKLVVIRLVVEFTNNYVVNVDLPYLSAKPELSVSYLSEGKIRL